MVWLAKAQSPSPSRTRLRKFTSSPAYDLSSKHEIGPPPHVAEGKTGPTAARRVSMGLRAMLFRSTYARHRIRHGIRHTVARAGRRPCPCVANGRLRHILIGYARVSKADGHHVDDAGMLISCTDVDVRAPAERLSYLFANGRSARVDRDDVHGESNRQGVGVAVELKGSLMDPCVYTTQHGTWPSCRSELLTEAVGLLPQR